MVAPVAEEGHPAPPPLAMLASVLLLALAGKPDP
jgi:hypothetical protein